MRDTFTYHPGTLPLLVSVPHDGRQLPCEIAGRMTKAGRAIPDTDWHVARLYDFVSDLGAHVIRAEYSRYVVDINRPANGEALYEGRYGSGLCPTQTFLGEDIYKKGTYIDIDQRVDGFWRPYHEHLEAVLNLIRSSHGYALLWDAHSIPSVVPRLFDGELPVMNLGTWCHRSCSAGIADAVMEIATGSGHSAIMNGRFTGGYITRHYGRPEEGIHVMQLELAQRAYMDETTLEFDEFKAAQLRATIMSMLKTFMAAAEKHKEGRA